MSYEIYERIIKEKGIKSAEVSRATGIPQPVFSEWKKGKSTPKIDKIKKIADFLGVSESCFIADSQEKEKTAEDALAASYIERPKMKEFVLLAGGILPQESQDRYLEGLIEALKSLRGIK